MAWNEEIVFVTKFNFNTFEKEGNLFIENFNQPLHRRQFLRTRVHPVVFLREKAVHAIPE